MSGSVGWKYLQMALFHGERSQEEEKVRPLPKFSKCMPSSGRIITKCKLAVWFKQKVKINKKGGFLCRSVMHQCPRAGTSMQFVFLFLAGGSKLTDSSRHLRGGLLSSMRWERCPKGSIICFCSRSDLSACQEAKTFNFTVSFSLPKSTVWHIFAF